jgi:hypothetical protein
MGPNTPNLKNLRDKMNHIQDSVLNNKEVFERSKNIGEDLGSAVIAYMQTDNYDYTRENNIYESPTRGGDPSHPERWEPTMQIKRLTNLSSEHCSHWELILHRCAWYFLP